MLSLVIFAGALVAVRVSVEPCKGCLEPVDPGKRWSIVKVIGYRVWGSSTSENERQLGKSSDQQLPNFRNLHFSSPLTFHRLCPKMDLLDGRILGGLQCKLYLNAEARTRLRRSKEINQFMIHFKSNCD
jgi:hypothetical protein